jgi:Rrf2 family protein
MILSKGCEYGLRAALYLALNQEEGFVPIRVISNKLEIPGHFLTKILQLLSQRGLLASLKGPRGGGSLSRPATEIAISDVVYAIDGPALFDCCVLGLTGCGDDDPCALHAAWMTFREQLRDLFETTTLSDVSSDIREQNLRIAHNHLHAVHDNG